MDVASTGREILQRKRLRLRLPERLPNLRGAWLAAYTIIWVITLALSLAGAAMGTVAAMTAPSTWLPYGFATSQDANGIRVDALPSPAVKVAGMKVGDHVIAVDGWAVPRTDPRATARPHVVKPDGSFTSFTLRRAGGEVYKVRLIRSRNVERQEYRAAGLSPTVAAALAKGKTLSIAVYISAAILLFLRRRREAVPALLSLGFLMFAGLTNDPSLAGVSFPIVSTLNMLASCLLFAGLFAFPAGRFEPRWTAVPLLLLPVLAVTWSSGPQGSVVALGFLLAALAALVARYRRLDPGVERQQLRWAFFGLAVGLSLQITEVLITMAMHAWQGEDPRWVSWYYFSASALDALTSCAVALGLIVAILRYRLYDADTVIGRSAAYGVLTLGFVASFAASQKIIELIGQEYLGQNLGGLAGGVAAALAAAAIAPMHARAQRWAERSFQQSLYKLRHGLPPLVSDLRETSGLDSIAGATLDRLIEGVRASRAALVAGDTLVDAREIAADEVEEWRRGWSASQHVGIDCDEADALFPVRVPLEAEGHGRVGWLLLGPRPDGSLFGKTEFQAIEEVAEPVARAAQVAIKREEREVQHARQLRALEDRFDAIDRRIDEIVQQFKTSNSPRKPWPL
jgi:hypothetical protein